MSDNPHAHRGAHDLRIGTCSWNYPSWNELVYQTRDRADYLSEYAARFNSVEVDRWFWSLFEDPTKVRMPALEDVRKYRDAVPETFRFGVKAPNSVTLTHLYKKDRSDKNERLQENPHFLSPELVAEFLERLGPMHDVLGPVMFQFEYLNKQKMASAKSFRDRFGAFASNLPTGHAYALEIRNKNYMTPEYFEWLLEIGVLPVLISGYWMPRPAALFEDQKKILQQFPTIIFRLMGEDRGEIEKTTNKEWNRIVKPHDKELEEIAAMVVELQSFGVKSFVFVNNHYEGSAPITIDRLMAKISEIS